MSSARQRFPNRFVASEDGNASPFTGSPFIDAHIVQIALDAGFSKNEVAFMLDRGDPAPDTPVEGEDLAVGGTNSIKVIE